MNSSNNKTGIKTGPQSNIYLLLGIFLILAGLTLNEFFLRYLMGPHTLISLLNRIIIWLFDIFAVTSGVILIRYRRKIEIRRRELIFSLIAFTLFIFILEGGIRGTYYVINKINLKERTTSDYYGWVTVGDIEVEREIDGYGKVHYSTTRDGFRRYGDPGTEKKKVLAIGDSVTQAYMVSDGETYYDRIGGVRGDVEIFAYGGGGFGTLQEYMILDTYIDEIKPDLIIWQFSGNDIINNDHTLESKSFRNNNHMTRPYLESGDIVYRYPKQNLGPLLNIIESSYLLRIISIKLNILKSDKGASIEASLTPESDHIKRSGVTTRKILEMAKERAGGVPIVAFEVNRKNWFGDTLERAARDAGLLFVEGVSEAIIEAQRRGERINGIPFDAHWNGRGHAIAGEVILDFLESREML